MRNLFLAVAVATAVVVKADEPRVTISAHFPKDAPAYLACSVPKDSLNRWLDIIVEDVSGEGFDLTEQDRTTYTFDLPQPLSCPFSGDAVEQTAVRAACELQWFDLLHGKMQIASSRLTLACEP